MSEISIAVEVTGEGAVESSVAEGSVVEGSVAEVSIMEGSVVEGSVVEVSFDGIIGGLSEVAFAVKVTVAISLLVRNFLDGWYERRIEGAAPVEISVAMEGGGVDLLDGAIGGAAEESFAVEATVEYSVLQGFAPLFLNLVGNPNLVITVL